MKILSIFNKKQPAIKSADTAEVIVPAPVKSVNEIIEEIHESFYTEVDKLLESAKIERSLETTKQELIDKCERLKALGFTSTKEVMEAETEITRLNIIKRDNEKNKELIEAINCFGFKYPQYKFITEDSVKRICKKYGLIYGDVSKYIGTVPDYNLKHIENFKIDEIDECWIERSGFMMHGDVSIRYISKLEIKPVDIFRPNAYYYTAQSICPLEIAAPVSDFNMSRMEIKDYKLSQIPDPIVLKPVMFKGRKHYLIVTAWGQEAADIDVVNEKMN